MGRSKQPGFCKNGHNLVEVGTVSKGWCSVCRAAAKAEAQCQKLYGISIAQRNEMLASQGNACKLCRRTDCIWGKGWLNVWHVDHIHAKFAKQVRGILCGRCNIFVGVLEKFGFEKAQQAWDYIRTAGQTPWAG